MAMQFDANSDHFVAQRSSEPSARPDGTASYYGNNVVCDSGLPDAVEPDAGQRYGRAEASLGMSVEVIVRRADEVGTGASS
jgi:hypothetical protein